MSISNAVGIQHSVLANKWQKVLPWLALIFDPKPAMALIVPAKGFCNHCISKSKEGSVLSPAVLQREVALQVLVIQHILHTISRHVSAQAACMLSNCIPSADDTQSATVSTVAHASVHIAALCPGRWSIEQQQR